MAKIPYLFKRNNVYYFRIRVPDEHRTYFKAIEIVQSLKTESRSEAVPQVLALAANFKSTLHKLNTGQPVASDFDIASLQLHYLPANAAPTPIAISPAPPSAQAPLLSIVINDFLDRYSPDNKATLTKLRSTLPVFLELIGDKPVNKILQTDVNKYFDLVQKLPVRRDAKIFSGMSIKKIIATHHGRTIAAGTFDSTYRACVSLFINWALVHYKDQGFPNLSVSGAVYRGKRKDGINKQRAFRPEELKILFTSVKMRNFALNADTAHCCWLPLIGLYTGCRINEVCQLNPFTDIKQDKKTGIHYFHFTDESESAEGVDKSVKTKSSHRIVPIHSKLLELGFLDYVAKVKNDGYKLIFPQWPPNHGKASAKVSKWFINFVRSLGLRDNTEGARLSGFHCFRHTLITYGIENKIRGIFSITGHETSTVDGFGVITEVAKGYWTQGLTDDILEKKAIVERFDFDIEFFRPS